jgi:hypothetical protein
LDPDELTAVTITVYEVPPDRPVNAALFNATPLSVEGIVGVPFTVYVYDVAPLPPDQFTENDVAVILEYTKLTGCPGGGLAVITLILFDEVFAIELVATI